MTNNYFSKNSVLVLGGHGFLGKHIVKKFQSEGWYVYAPKHEECDLLNKDSVIKHMYSFNPLKVIINCAGKVGGIFANQKDQFGFFMQNAQMAMNVAEVYKNAYAHMLKTDYKASGAWSDIFDTTIPKYFYIASSCMYPRDCPQPMKEEYLGTGKFEPTNEGYALAKTVGMKTTEWLSTEHGLPAHTIIPPNLYGVGDNYGEGGHFIAAAVKKIIDAKVKNIKSCFRGSGTAQREIMTAKDAAIAIFLAATYKKELPQTFNIGTEYAFIIRQLVDAIALELDLGLDHVEFENQDYDPKIDGMPIKIMDVSFQKNCLGFIPKDYQKEEIQTMAREYQYLYHDKV